MVNLWWLLLTEGPNHHVLTTLRPHLRFYGIRTIAKGFGHLDGVLCFWNYGDNSMLWHFRWWSMRARARTTHKIMVFLVYHSWWLTILHQTFTKSIGHHGSDITYKKFKQKLNMLAYRWLSTRARARAYTYTKYINHSTHHIYWLCNVLSTPMCQSTIVVQ